MANETHLARRIALTRLQEEYRDLAPLARRFSETLASELHQLVQRHDLALAVPIEHRVKTWPSIEEKLSRGWEWVPFSGASLTELDDLVGVRLILLFRRDLTTVCRLVEESLEILHHHDKADELSHEQFGYQSFHFIVRPPSTWLTVPTFSTFRGLQAEVQIRTLAQHLWAATSHKLQYKQESSVPPPVRRSIHRVSALLETVDLEFERLLTERDAYRATVETGSESRRLNSDVLEATLDKLLPRENKEAFEPYSLLVWELENLGIRTTGEVEKLVRKHLPTALATDAKYVAQGRERGNVDDRTKVGVFLSYSGLVRMILEQEFGEDFYSRVWEKAEKDEQAKDH